MFSAFSSIKDCHYDGDDKLELNNSSCTRQGLSDIESLGVETSFSHVVAKNITKTTTSHDSSNVVSLLSKENEISEDTEGNGCSLNV